MTIKQVCLHSTTEAPAPAPSYAPDHALPQGAGAFFWLLTIASCIAVAHAANAVEQSSYSAFVTAVLLQGAIYLTAVMLVLGRRHLAGTLVPILIVAALLRGLALTPPPNLSTDVYRYIWDGRVQAAGLSPYLHVPADQRLAHLRDQTIYPNINQKDRAVTIYPPAAELLFLLAHHIEDGLFGMRVVMAALDLITIAALLALLAALRLPREHVLIYAWHPLPIWEFVCHAHIDAAVTALIALGLLAAVRARQALAGSIFAVAVLTKYFPLVLLPAIWRQWEWRMPAAFAATAIALYLPFVWTGGVAVLGFLPQHLDNEGYAAGWGFHPVWLLRDFGLADPPAALYVAFALAVLAGLALWVLFRRAADAVRLDALVWLGAAFIFLTSPHYPWYFAFLTALLTMAPNPAVLAMTLLAPLLYLPQPPGGLSWTHLYLLVYWLPVAIALCWGLWKIDARRVQ